MTARQEAMNPPDLDALEAALAAATPGPWRAGWDQYIEYRSDDPNDFPEDGWANVNWDTEGLGGTWRNEADLRLVVVAVNSLPALIAAARERDRLREALERTLTNFENLLARKPVRDVAETIVEARAALQGRSDAVPAERSKPSEPSNFGQQPAAPGQWIPPELSASSSKPEGNT